MNILRGLLAGGQKDRRREERERRTVPLPELPVEIWLLIVARLPPRSIVNSLFFTCRDWYQVTRNEIVWRLLYDVLSIEEVAHVEPIEPKLQEFIRDQHNLEPYLQAHAFTGSYFFTRQQLRSPVLYDSNARDKDFVDWRGLLEQKVALRKRNLKPILIKVVVMGDLGVGKTSLLMRFCTDKFTTDPPVVFRNYTARTYCHHREIGLSLWDTEMWDTSFGPTYVREAAITDAVPTDGEDYTGMRMLTYPNTDVFLLCFSVANRESFSKIKSRWVTEVHKYGLFIGYTFVLCGTHADIDENNRAVSHKEGVELATTLGAYAYIETSALSGQGVDTVFQACIDSIYESHMEVVNAFVPNPKVKRNYYMNETIAWQDPYYGAGELVQAPNFGIKGRLYDYILDWHTPHWAEQFPGLWRQEVAKNQSTFATPKVLTDYAATRDPTYWGIPNPKKIEVNPHL